MIKLQKKEKKSQKKLFKKPRELLTETHDSSDEDVTEMPVQLDDSTEYFEEDIEDLEAPYPFQVKAPTEGD